MKKMVNWDALPRTLNPEESTDKYLKYLANSTTKYNIDPIRRQVDQDQVEPYMRAVEETPREDEDSKKPLN